MYNFLIVDNLCHLAYYSSPNDSHVRFLTLALCKSFTYLLTYLYLSGLGLGLWYCNIICLYFCNNTHVVFVLFRLDALALSVIATATWLGGWLAGWLGGCHTPVLYQNGLTYPKTFSTIWKPHHSSFLRPLRRYKITRRTLHRGR